MPSYDGPREIVKEWRSNISRCRRISPVDCLTFKGKYNMYQAKATCSSDKMQRSRLHTLLPHRDLMDFHMELHLSAKETCTTPMRQTRKEHVKDYSQNPQYSLTMCLTRQQCRQFLMPTQFESGSNYRM